jgi:hypothetical protein
MRGENFIYFLTVSGFFIGLFFAVLKDFSIENIVFFTILITSIFYLIALASVAFFVKYINIKNISFFDKKEIDQVLDMQIRELQKKEENILYNYEFIKQIEEEELKILKKNKA